MCCSSAYIHCARQARAQSSRACELNADWSLRLRKSPNEREEHERSMTGMSFVLMQSGISSVDLSSVGKPTVELVHPRALHSDSSVCACAPPFQHPGGPARNFGFAVVSASGVAATQKTVSTGTQCTPGGWLTPGGP